MYNACLGEALRRLDLMRDESRRESVPDTSESPAWVQSQVFSMTSDAPRGFMGREKVRQVKCRLVQ
jgi:hypothetical protein